MIHPWRRLRALAHITLTWHDDGPMGITDYTTDTISLRRDLDQAARRSTVLHECLHVERGRTLTTLAAQEEQRVRKLCARELLPDLPQIGDALAWALTLEEAADDLWVDPATLRTRLDHLHPAERHWLRRRLAQTTDQPDLPHDTEESA